MFLSETNEKNEYLLGFFIRMTKNETGIYLFLLILLLLIRLQI